MGDQGRIFSGVPDEGSSVEVFDSGILAHIEDVLEVRLSFLLGEACCLSVFQSVDENVLGLG
jgi:hypothetical protein